MKFDDDEISAFFSKIEVRGENDCWRWQGKLGQKGYGHVYIAGMLGKAHRVALMMATGRNIPAGMHVMHSCDTPSCVNPKHLATGTNAENVADKVNKNRQARNLGMNASIRKLNDNLVKQLMWDRVAGMTFQGIGRKYGLNAKTVAMICDGSSWPHIPGTEGAPTLTQLLLVPKERRIGADLTEDEVSLIMSKLRDGEPGKVLAREFEVHFQTISDIKNGRSWAALAGVNGNPTVNDMQTAWPKSKHTAKLTEAIAIEIKRRLAAGDPVKDIAAAHGLSLGAVYHIRQGKTWA